MRGNNSVLYALDNLSRTVRGLGRDKGQHDISMGNIGLQRSRQDYDIGRQTRADERSDELHELGRPMRELESQEGLTAQKAYNTQLTSSHLMTSPKAAEYWLWTNPETKKVNLDRFPEDMNYDADKSEPGIVKYFHKGTNTPVIWGESAQDVVAYGSSRFDEDRGIRAKKETLYRRLRNKKISQEQYNKEMEQMQTKANDPVVQIQKAQARIDRHTPYAKNFDWAKKRIAKDEARIQQLQDALRKEKAADKRAALDRRATGVGDGLKYQKEMRANINSAMKIAGNYLGFGEGWGGSMSSMDENQRAAHGNYTALIGAMAGKGLYAGNPASLAKAAIQIDGAVNAEAEKRAGAIEDGYFKKQGISREQWIQQAKGQLMQDAMGQLGNKPTIQNNKFKLKPEEINEIKEIKAGKSLSGIGGLLDSTKKGSAKPVSQMSPDEQAAELKRREAEQGSSPLELYLEKLRNTTPEQREVGIQRKKDRDKKTFLRKAPGL